MITFTLMLCLGSPLLRLRHVQPWAMIMSAVLASWLHVCHLASYAIDIPCSDTLPFCCDRAHMCGACGNEGLHKIQLYAAGE